MSLLDALLLEPCLFEVWIAQRSSKGTGTLNDQYGVKSADDFDTERSQAGRAGAQFT